MLESARHENVPNLADQVLGSHRHGSWWRHPRGKEFFGLTRQLRSNKDIFVSRLVGGKITYVHRRLWPALIKAAPMFRAEDLSAVREVHTTTGAHRVELTPFNQWISAELRQEGMMLTIEKATSQLGADVLNAARRRDGAKG